MTGKKLFGIIAGTAAAVIVTGGIAIYYFVSTSPIYRLGMGIKHLKEEIDETESPLFAEEGVSEFITMLGNNSAMADYKMTVAGHPMLKGITIGMDGTIKRDMGEKKFYTDTALSVSRIPIAEMQLYGEQDNVFVQMPSIFEGSVVCKANDFDGQYNRSALKDLIGKEMNQDIDLDFFPRFEGWKKEDGFLDAYQGDIKALLQDIHIREEKEYEIDQQVQEKLEEAFGTEQELTAYLITIDSDRLEFQEPLELRVILNKSNHILMVETVENITLKKTYQGGAKILLVGEESSIDRILAKAKLQKSDENSDAISTMEVCLCYHPEADTLQIEGTGTLDIWKPDMEIDIDATLSDFVSNEKAKLVVDQLDITKRSEDFMKIKGQITMQNMADSITLPHGQEYAILEMDKLELGLLLWKWKGDLLGPLEKIIGSSKVIW